jgi:hypothetical protein
MIPKHIKPYGNTHFIKLTDRVRDGQILFFTNDIDKGVAGELIYDPKTDKWEWANMSLDYTLPFSPLAWMYESVTRDQVDKLYPTALKSLDKEPEQITGWQINEIAPDEIDPYA